MVSQVLFQFFLIFGRLPILSPIREICLLPYEKFISLSSWLYFLSYQHFVSTLGKQLGINHIPLSYICILLHSCPVLCSLMPLNICLPLKIPKQNWLLSSIPLHIHRNFISSVTEAKTTSFVDSVEFKQET